MEAHTKETQDKMTPDKSLNELKLGNQRFVNKNQLKEIYYNRLKKQVLANIHSQQYSAVLILESLQN